MIWAVVISRDLYSLLPCLLDRSMNIACILLVNEIEEDTLGLCTVSEQMDDFYCKANSLTTIEKGHSWILVHFQDFNSSSVELTEVYSVNSSKTITGKNVIHNNVALIFFSDCLNFSTTIWKCSEIFLLLFFS